MQKFFSTIIIAVVSLCLAACSLSPPTHTAEQLDREQKTVSEASEHASPPKQLTFHGFDEIAELSKLLDKSDSEVEEYLLNYDASRLYMNGLENKKDIENLLVMLSEIYLPVMEGVPDVYITVFPDGSTVWVSYNEIASGDTGAPYAFTISTELNSAQKKLQAIQEDGTILYGMSADSSLQADALSGVTGRAPDGIEIYPQVNDKNNAAYDKYGSVQTIYMDIKGQYIMVRMSNANELSVCVNSLLSFDYAKLSFTENGAQVVEIVGKDMSQSSDVQTSEENELNHASE